MDQTQVIFDCARGLRTIKTYCLISGGKDSIATYFKSKDYIKIDGVVFIDTTIGLKVTKDFVINFCKEQNVPLHIIKPKKSYAEYVKKYGFPHPSQHQQVMLELKWKPLYYFAKSKIKEFEGKRNERICFLSGTRSTESTRRMKHANPITTDPTYNRMYFLAPLYYWSTIEVWNYKKELGYDISPTYKTLHLSGDCLCGAFAQKGEKELIATFYPEMHEYILTLEKIANTEHKGKIKGWGNEHKKSNSLDQQKVKNVLCAECENN